MKYIKTFESHKEFMREESINEELFGGILNFFKNLWNKAVEDIKKLGEKPTMEQLDQWIEANSFSPNSSNYIFKSIIDEFKKKIDTDINDQDCLSLIDSILDPETGAMGKQGLQSFYDGLLKVFGKNLAPVNTIEYYFTSARNRAIKDYKYAGGPDNGKVDPAKKNLDLKNMDHLPDLKKLLIAATDPKSKKQATINWVEKTLLPRMLKYIQEVKPEDVKKYLESKGINEELSGEFKVGDTVIYKREKFKSDEWTIISDDDKKKIEEGKIKEMIEQEMIGIKKISKIENNIVSFESTEFTKPLSDILMKIDINGQKSEEAKKTAELLGKIKDDPDKMKQISNYAEFMQDPNNKDKMDEIGKIIDGDAKENI